MAGTAESVNAAPAEKPPLDDVMLAMDVVDTLRHRQDLVARELGGEAREKQLIDKLREIYHQQGIEVPDSVLKEGVAALEQSRFAYTPPPPSLKRSLAHFYVNRKRWGPAAIAIGIALALVFGGYFLVWQPWQGGIAEQARIELTQELPAQMDGLYQSIFTETKVQKAVTDAEAIRTRGKAAAAAGNRSGAEAAIASLTTVRDSLRQEYSLRIVNRAGEDSAFWRIPEINTDATNYYVVVEALDSGGAALSLPIANEETGRTETVATWGVRVPESVYRAVEADKRDDGIVQRSVIGVKEYGFLDVRYGVPVLGGAVTEW